MNVNGLIYLITNIVNGKIYVGQTRKTLTQRWSAHKRDVLRLDSPLYRSIRKYGIDNFTIRTLECIRCCSKPELIEALNTLERNAIKKHNSMIDSGKGYNLTDGGGVCLVSEYTRRKMSETRMGFSPDQATRDKIRKSLLGRPISGNTRHLLSLANGGINHPNYGRHHSLSTRQMMRVSHLGKTMTQTARENMSDVYSVMFSCGKSKTIIGLKQFCKSRGYDRKNIYRVMVGLQSHHKNIIGVKKVE